MDCHERLYSAVRLRCGVKMAEEKGCFTRCPACGFKAHRDNVPMIWAEKRYQDREDKATRFSSAPATITLLTSSSCSTNGIWPGAIDGGAKTAVRRPRATRPLAPVYPGQALESPQGQERGRGTLGTRLGPLPVPKNADFHLRGGEPPLGASTGGWTELL